MSIFLREAVGNQRRFLLSEQVGRTGVYARLKRLLPDISRDDPRVKRVTERLKRREPARLRLRERRRQLRPDGAGHAGHRANGDFEVRDFHVLSGNQRDERSAQAYIKVSVDGREEINAAEGDGPVNALDLALRKALLVFYPQVERMRLRDFKRCASSTAAAPPAWCACSSRAPTAAMSGPPRASVPTSFRRAWRRFRIP